MKRTVATPSRNIIYELERKAVKNINLRVRPDGSVFVSANSRVPVARVDSFVLSKAQFILNAQERFGRLAASRVPRQCAEGEAVQIFGVEKMLHVRCGSDCVAEEADSLTLTMRDPSDAEARARTLEKFLRARCEQVTTACCKRLFTHFLQYGVSFPQIKFRKMRSRWGSCTPTRGRVTFNYALVAAPLECVEYVVAHELCHLLHPDHSPAFYASLGEVLPDWRQRKQLLNATCSAL